MAILDYLTLEELENLINDTVLLDKTKLELKKELELRKKLQQ